jgi:hypothetical protein
VVPNDNVSDTVVRLANCLRRQNHIICMDNLYTRPSVLLRLRQLPFPRYAVGTWRSNYECPSIISGCKVAKGKFVAFCDVSRSF